MDSILSLLTDPAAWIAFGTLAVMEIVLGIDNLIFISILTNKLPESERHRARRIGIAGALLLRLGFLTRLRLLRLGLVPAFTPASFRRPPIKFLRN